MKMLWFTLLPLLLATGCTAIHLLPYGLLFMSDCHQCIGEYSLVWDATDGKNNLVSSGIYFYKLETSDCTLQKKMILVR
jgi:hypothetical protein